MRERTDGSGHAQRSLGTSRRDFLKLSAMAAFSAAAGSALSPAIGGGALGRLLTGTGPRSPVAGRGNAMPGRIVLYRDPQMEGEQPTINRDQVEAVVHDGVRILTGVDDTAAAFEALFPGLDAGSTIGIKVNCLAWNDTRWEVVRGVVSGLSLMLGGTYDVGQVTIYDVQTYLPDHGYVEGEFTFNGNVPLIRSSEDCGSYYVYEDHRLSNHVLNSEYIVNVPVLKAHNAGYPEHLITTALKNHYGSLCPQNLCNNITGMLTVNADPQIKEKTALVVTSALRGTYNGGPWEPPQLWNTFPEQTPNTLFLTTDPVTEAYWARDVVNTERIDRGWDPFGCPWIEQASEPPYNLGISDPEQMTVIQYAPSGVTDRPASTGGVASLAPSVPNPFARTTTLRFQLARPGRATLVVVGPTGGVVRRLLERELPAGSAEARWDGRDGRGRRLPAGVYFARLEAAGVVRTRRIVFAP